MSRIAKRLDLVALDTHMGTFDFTIRTIIGKYENAEKYAAHIFEIKDGLEDSNFGYEPRGKCFYRTGYVPIVWIPRYPKTPREYATLAHEACHAVAHMFGWAAIPVSPDTDEVFAHAVGHVVNDVLERGKKK